MDRVTHRHITRAVNALNARRGLTYPAIGYTLYQDVGGWGGPHRPGLYTIFNEGGGVRAAYGLRGKTLRDTLARINAA